MLTVRTTGEFLADGSLLEIINSSGNGPALLVAREKRTTVKPKFRHNHTIYIPVDPQQAGLGWLPSNPVPCVPVTELFASLKEFLSRFIGLREQYLSLLTFFILASWFPDCLEATPCFLFWGPPAEALTLLSLLRCLCRHAVMVPDLASLHFPWRGRPTILSASAKKLDAFLAKTQFSNFSAGTPNEQRSGIGASALYVGDHELRTQLAGLCIQIPLPPIGCLFTGREQQAEFAAIKSFQNRMLAFRLAHYAAVKASCFDVPEFSAGVRRLARALGSVAGDASDLQTELKSILQPFNDSLQSDQAETPEGLVIEALLVCCHERKTRAYVGEISDRVNQIVARVGGNPYTPRRIGELLRSLAFCTRRTAEGRCLNLDRSVCQRIHGLARDYDVLSGRNPLSGCSCCSDSPANASG